MGYHCFLFCFFYSSRLWSIWLTQFSLRSHEYDAKRSKAWLTIFFQIWVKAKLSEPCCTVETLFLETVFHYCTSAKHILPVIVTTVWNGLLSLFECNPVTNAPITNYRWCHCAEMAFCSSSNFWHHAYSYHITRPSQRRSIKTECEKKNNAIFSHLAVLLWRGQHCEVLDLQTASRVLCTLPLEDWCSSSLCSSHFKNCNTAQRRWIYFVPGSVWKIRIYKANKRCQKCQPDRYNNIE